MGLMKQWTRILSLPEMALSFADWKGIFCYLRLLAWQARIRSQRQPFHSFEIISRSRIVLKRIN